MIIKIKFLCVFVNLKTSMYRSVGNLGLMFQG